MSGRWARYIAEQNAVIGRLLRRGVQAYRQGNMWVESGSERGGGRERERKTEKEREKERDGGLIWDGKKRVSSG